MIRRITGIILGVVAFLLVFWLTGGFATPATPNWALAILVGLAVASIWPWIVGLIVVRRAKQRRQDEINQEVQKQLAQQDQAGAVARRAAGITAPGPGRAAPRSSVIPATLRIQIVAMVALPAINELRTISSVRRGKAAVQLCRQCDRPLRHRRRPRAWVSGRPGRPTHTDGAGSARKR